MSGTEHIGRGDIMTRVGVGRDVVTFWIRGGVLKPIEAPNGDGKKLWFPWYEANIAAIMNQLRTLGVKIDGMLSIGRAYREAIAFFEGFNLKKDQIYALWSLFGHFKAMRSEGEQRVALIKILNRPDFDRRRWLSTSQVVDCSNEEEALFWLESLQDLYSEKHGARRLTDDLAELGLNIPEEEFYRHLELFLSITGQPKADSPIYSNIEEMTLFWRVGEGEDYQLAWGISAGEKARQDGAVALIAVDVDAAIYRVWNPA